VRSLHVDYYHPERRLVIRAIQEKWNSAQRNILGKVLAIGEETALYQPGLPYIGLANVESDNGIFVESSDEEPEGLCRRFLHGQVLYGKLRPYLNKVYIAQSDGQCSTEFFVLNVLEQTQLSNEFLQAYLTSKICLAQTVHMMTGNTHPRILREDFKEILIPLPPFANQRALVAEMQAARASRQQKLAQADALLAGLDAYLLEQLGITPPQEDKRQVYAVRLGDLKDGRTDPHFHHPDFRKLADTIQQIDSAPLGRLVKFSSEAWNPEQATRTTFRYIEISGINTQTGEVTPAEISVSDAPSRARMLVQNGDILVSLTRPQRGAIALIDDELDNCIASTGFAIIREIVSPQINRDYLWCVLRSQICLRQMLQRSSGGNYPAITQDELGKITVPIASSTIQETIVAELNHRRATARQLRAQAAAEWDAAKARFEKKLLGS
jgi:restriction endonuclease S subunit